MADIEAIRRVFTDDDYLFTAHASDRAAERAIRSTEIVEAVASGEVKINTYTNHHWTIGNRI